MGIPRSRRPAWKRTTTWLLICDVAVAIGAALFGITTVLRYWAEGQRRPAIATAVAAGAVLIFTAVRAVLQYVERSRKESTHDLLGCLQTLRGTLEASAPEIADAGLRVTLFVPVHGGSELEQACDYTCRDRARRKDTAGRRVASTAGAIGRAFQTGNYAVAQRVTEDPGEHIADLIASWGFSAEAARRVDPTVRASMAVPLTTPERGVEAIVYVDARVGDFFTESRQMLVLGGCGAIALFAQQRYN
jgi:hypothetical protein